MPLVGTDAGGLGEAGTFRATLAYGFAHYGKSLFWYAGELLFAFFLTEIAGLSGSEMGLVLGLGLLVSAAADLVVGGAARRVLASTGAALRLQFGGAVISAAALFAFFASVWIAPGDRMAHALAVGLIFRIAYALYDLPQNALVSLATTTDTGRTDVVAMRFVFSGLASLTVAGLTVPVFLAGDPATRALRSCILAAAFSAVAIASAACLVRALRRCPDPPLHPAPRPGAELSSRGHGFLAVLVGLMFVSSLAGPVFSKLEPYYAAYVLRDPLLGGTMMTAVALGAAGSQPLWAWLGRGVDRSTGVFLSAAAVAASATLFALASERGGIVIFCGLLFGAAKGGLGHSLWAAFGDVVARKGRDRAAASFAWFTASSKVALALGAWGVGLFLSQVEFRGADSGVLVFAMAGAPLLAGASCAVIAGAWSWRASRAASSAPR